tara:strand:+ start:670 stop:1761 length:1092 start_codon:yes stop_codon:yes gene_type:complete
LGLLFLYGFLTILLSFLCSILEAVLLSVNPTFIKIKIKDGLKYAEDLQKLKNSIDEPLVIILTLNTIAHTVGAILVGVQAKITYATLNVDNTYSLFGLQVTEESLIGIVSAIMTVLVLILSEIIPKTIGARYWDKLARITTVTLMSIIPIFKITGVLWLLKFFSNIAGKSERKSIFKREDISTLAEIAEEQGVIKEKDSDFIKNIVKLQNVKLREIMTPSSVIKSADMDSTIEDFYSKNKKLPFSRIPIYANNKEEINYYVLKDTILEYVIQKNGKKKLSDIKRPIIKIGYESKITTLFDKLLKKREHISLVIDEFGAVRGIVTLEDIIETLLGLEIVDETDTVVDLQVLAKKRRKQYLKDVD